MSNRRTLMAAAAIVLAAVAGIGVYVYASNADSRAQENAQFVDAFVASRATSPRARPVKRRCRRA